MDAARELRPFGIELPPDSEDIRVFEAKGIDTLVMIALRLPATSLPGFLASARLGLDTASVFFDREDDDPDWWAAHDPESYLGAAQRRLHAGRFAQLQAYRAGGAVRIQILVVQ